MVNYPLSSKIADTSLVPIALVAYYLLYRFNAIEFGFLLFLLAPIWLLRSLALCVDWLTSRRTWWQFLLFFLAPLVFVPLSNPVIAFARQQDFDASRDLMVPFAHDLARNIESQEFDEFVEMPTGLDETYRVAHCLRYPDGSISVNFEEPTRNTRGIVYYRGNWRSVETSVHFRGTGSVQLEENWVAY